MPVNVVLFLKALSLIETIGVSLIFFGIVISAGNVYFVPVIVVPISSVVYKVSIVVQPVSYTHLDVYKRQRRQTSSV